jgi:hypothetical protein
MRIHAEYPKEDRCPGSNMPASGALIGGMVSDAAISSSPSLSA